MKYKACCERRCLIHKCKIRDQGGCYCVCRLSDAISQIQSVIDGKTIRYEMGFVYIPDDDLRQKDIDRMTKEQKEYYETYKNSCHKEIERLKEKLKEYEI